MKPYETTDGYYATEEEAIAAARAIIERGSEKTGRHVVNRREEGDHLIIRAPDGRVEGPMPGWIGTYVW